MKKLIAAALVLALTLGLSATALAAQTALPCPGDNRCQTTKNCPAEECVNGSCTHENCPYEDCVNGTCSHKDCPVQSSVNRCKGNHHYNKNRADFNTQRCDNACRGNGRHKNRC